MHTWLSPQIPELDRPERTPTLALYDTAAQAVVSTGSAPGLHPTGSDPDPRRRTMYVCGITPYDATHLGHAATMITFDLINRVWRDEGHTVTYVQNVTDVDDPLLARAIRDGVDWQDLALRETELFRGDMAALRIIPPAFLVGAVESIPAIREQVAALLDQGAGYRLTDGTGDVYFDLTTAVHFGYESHLDRDSMLRISAERGGDPDRPGKRDPLDPLLWRAARPDEPFWPSGDLGPGRPGWHIECAVIARQHLGSTIDVQGGGNDLIFPHHECSAAHAEVASGEKRFARHYVHAGMIGLDGEKMSKSRGNLLLVSRMLRDGTDPMALRLALIAGHYRTDRDVTAALLDTARTRWTTWQAALGAAGGPESAALAAAVRAALANDLDTPTVLRAVDDWCATALSDQGPDPDAPAQVAALLDALLGIRAS
jgi:L-cysteine:1D-myo-inositol 2-amino-2-deoxy-alpha-D-glucopyranoside ligase